METPLLTFFKMFQNTSSFKESKILEMTRNGFVHLASKNLNFEGFEAFHSSGKKIYWICQSSCSELSVA